MLSAWKRQTRVRATARGFALLCGLIVLLGAAAPLARAQNPPPQEPGVTQRVFQLAGAPSEICTIKAGQTPNVDALRPTIDWSGDAAFGGPTQIISIPSGPASNDRMTWGATRSTSHSPISTISSSSFARPEPATTT